MIVRHRAGRGGARGTAHRVVDPLASRLSLLEWAFLAIVGGGLTALFVGWGWLIGRLVRP